MLPPCYPQARTTYAVALGSAADIDTATAATIRRSDRGEWRGSPGNPSNLARDTWSGPLDRNKALDRLRAADTHDELAAT